MQLLLDYLAALVTPERLETLHKVVDQRTRYLTVVLEDIFQPQNASAVLRTCDCFGIQDVHIIENTNEYCINPDVVLGASQWLSIYNYNTEAENTTVALQSLKQQGYRIVATSPHAEDDSLQGFDVTQQKTALVFGTELTGISDAVKQQADAFVKIPMYGFTESFNISVSAALILQQVSAELRKSSVVWQLEEEQKERLLIDWLKKSVKHSDKVLRRFYQDHPDLIP